MSYRLTHPDSTQEIEVNAEQVPLYQSQGWKAEPDPATPPSTSDPDAQSD